MLALVGCSGLPPMPDRVSSTRLPPADTTALGRAVQAANPGDGRSGFLALPNPQDAFVARMLLAQTAGSSLDVRYYIWRPDTTGLMLLQALAQAAERGVRVRLLLDDNGVAGMDPLLAALDAHPRAEVRLFNPYPQRSFKALGYLRDFARLNRRMHNKAFVADTQAAIVGGRNVSDAYFGADPALEFTDLDLLVAGPVADDIATTFDAYWHSAVAYPLSALVQEPPAAARAPSPDPRAATYAQGLRDSALARQIEAGQLELEWAPMRVVADPPAKAEGRAAPSEWMAADLVAALGPAQREADLVSPYFVPGAGGTQALARYPTQGVSCGWSPTRWPPPTWQPCMRAMRAGAKTCCWRACSSTNSSASTAWRERPRGGRSAAVPPACMARPLRWTGSAPLSVRSTSTRARSA